MEEKDYYCLKLDKKECSTLIIFLIKEIEEEKKALFKEEISKDEKEKILNRINSYNVLIGIIQSSMR